MQAIFKLVQSFWEIDGVFQLNVTGIRKKP